MKPSSQNALTFNNNDKNNTLRWCFTINNALPPSSSPAFSSPRPSPSSSSTLLPLTSSPRANPGTEPRTRRSPTSSCYLPRGRWVREARPETYYTNETCATIPESKNCFSHGRRGKGFLDWRWRPYGCEVPRFDASRFLEMVREKTMAFVGDSVARNHVVHD